MAETWIEKAEAVERNIIKGNHSDAKRLLKGQSRNQRWDTISWIKDNTGKNTSWEKNISESVLWEYVRVCIEGDFK